MQNGAERPLSRPAARPCPVCGQPASPAQVPFCSARCADVDLHRWLSGAYAVPGSAEDFAARAEDRAAATAGDRGDSGRED